MASEEQQPPKRNIDDRLDALTMNAELFSRYLEQFRAEGERLRAEGERLHVAVESLRASTADLVITSRQDGENIRTLARIAEIHERRLTAVEGTSAPPK